MTRVIEHAVAAASGAAQFVVLSGEQLAPLASLPPFPPGKGRCEGWRSHYAYRTQFVPGLSYQPGKAHVDPDTLVRRLVASAEDALGAAPDVWHFHNHSLGKNCALNDALFLIARKHRILLQIHDFAEDGRPELFHTLLRGAGHGDIHKLGRRVYPQAANIHYAALNSRDRDLLVASGVPSARLHLLPNPVVMPCMVSTERQLTASGPGERMLVYPTRAIRRKNIGEFLLWSAIAEKGDRFAVTLAPENPRERPAYDEWVRFAAEHDLPVEFEIGSRSGLSLSSLLSRSHAAVTTSIAEGFGLAFLEPWLLGRPALGRGLPEITADFEGAGLDLAHLYEKLLVPLGRNDRASLLKKIRVALEKTRSEYGRAYRTGDAEKSLSSAMRDGLVDFGRLDEELQRKFICRAQSSRSFRNEMTPRRLAPGDIDWRPTVIRNRACIKRAFSPERYGRLLVRVYEKVAASTIEKPEACFNINKLLDEFLSPERFFLLRS